MAVISFTIPNDKIARVVDAWSQGYSSTITDGENTIPNPQNKNEYARQQIMAVVKAKTVEYEQSVATQGSTQTIENARVAAHSKALNEITIT
jgi:hypothetical protein